METSVQTAVRRLAHALFNLKVTGNLNFRR
jgi:hypothetical protein